VPERPDLDATDRAILQALADDGRATLQEIADRVGLRRPSVHERIRKLEARGVIRGYRAELDPEAMGGGLVAFVQVRLEASGQDCLARCEQAAKALRKFPEVLEFHTIAGSEDALLKVRVADVRALERLVMRDISGAPGVGRVATTVVLSTSFERPLAVPGPRKREARA
jgi:Lrp/AsnC family leucine-responsive transcriptional regulator